MRAHHLILALALMAPTLAHAQGAAPQDKVQGRNSWLKERLTPLAGRVRAHVVKLTGGKSSGYGVVVKAGYILTSDGLIGSSRTLKATDSEGRTHVVVVHGRQRKHGVAILKFKTVVGTPVPIAMGASKSLALGQIVAVIGTEATPLAAGVVSATKRPVEPSAMGGGGNIFLKMFGGGGNSGHSRRYPSVIQHDSPLEPEHFGAPLVDRKGRLVGINVAYPFRGSAHAIGVDTFGKALQDLFDGKSTAPADRVKPIRPAPKPKPPQPARPRSYLGASVAPATPSQLGKGHAFGLYVRSLTAGGPAATCGLEKGDVIVTQDGQPFASIAIFGKRMTAKRPGDTMKLRVLRGAAGIETEVSVVLGKR
ncbi:MAG: serine protease [Planctomycetes bacterium]|nr:serine protease [Planctomycetota bacterium]